MRLLRRASLLAALALAAVSCDAIFGITPGASGTGGGGGSGTSTGSETSTGSSTSSTSSGTSTSSTSSTSSGTSTGSTSSSSGTSTSSTSSGVASSSSSSSGGVALERLGVGHARACAIEDDRSVKCWGNNDSGSLVPGNLYDQVRKPAAVDGVAGARQISVATSHQCVLQDDGTVTCWGDNGGGQLGFSQGGTLLPAAVPGLVGAVEVRTAGACTCARLADGSIQCLGSLDGGCLGTASQQTGQQTTPTPIGVTGAVALRMGYYAPSCALLASGGVTCWSDVLVPTPVPNVTGAVEIAVALNHVFIRTSTGVSWSALATDKSGWTTPVSYGLSQPFVAMAAGDQICGLRADGTVTCAFADPPGPSVALPMQPSGAVAEIGCGSSGGYFTGLCCLRLAGPIASSVSCWGDDAYGALGIGAPEILLTPEQPTLSPPASFLSASDTSTAAVLSDGSAVFWGNAGAFSDQPVSTPVGLGLNTDNLAIQDNDREGSAYVIKKSGALVLLVNGAQVPSGGLSGSGFSDFIDARTFNDWDVGLRQGGTVVVFTGAGDGNSGGVLGNGTTTAVAGMNVAVPGITGATALAAYGYVYDPSHAHVCVIAGGAVWCWGNNTAGEVGNNTVAGTLVLAPAQVMPSTDPAVSIAAGYAFTCAATTSGKVYCWGANDQGQIGQMQGTSMVPLPTQILGITNAVGVTAHDAHACAWLSDGKVVCWGQNLYGQLGDGTVDIPWHPVQVQGVTTAVQVAAGIDHTCARLAGGAVTCWGSSYDGEGGTGKTGRYGAPQAVLGL